MTRIFLILRQHKMKVMFDFWVFHNTANDSWGKDCFIIMLHYHCFDLIWRWQTWIIYLNGFLFVNKHEVRQWLRKWWEQWWSQKCSSQKWWWLWWRLQWFWRTRCRWWRQDFFEKMRKLGSLKKSKSEQNQDDVI